MTDKRPKLSPAEIELILKAMKEAGFDTLYGDPEYYIWRRFQDLQKGWHTKRRIRRLKPDSKPVIV